MFRNTGPGNAHVQDEPEHSTGELARPETRGYTQLYKGV